MKIYYFENNANPPTNPHVNPQTGSTIFVSSPVVPYKNSGGAISKKSSQLSTEEIIRIIIVVIVVIAAVVRAIVFWVKVRRNYGDSEEITSKILSSCEIVY